MSSPDFHNSSSRDTGNPKRKIFEVLRGLLFPGIFTAAILTPLTISGFPKEGKIPFGVIGGRMLLLIIIGMISNLMETEKKTE
ncbi:hypothetical protein DITRI_Ditri12bG0102100 [Diplodiscus trichospermus]